MTNTTNTKNTFRTYGATNRAVTTYVAKHADDNALHHKLFSETIFHGFTSGDFTMTNAILRITADSDRKFMLDGLKLVVGENKVTFKTEPDGNGNICFVWKNKSKKFVQYTPEQAAETALSIPFFKDLEAAYKAEQKVKRDLAKIENAAKKAAEASEASKDALTEIDNVIELHGANEPVSVYSDVWELVGKVSDLLGNGKVSLNDLKFAESFVKWFAKNDILQTEEKKDGTNG